MDGSTDILALRLTDLNSVLTCRLCNGYLIDATTITECLHTFCRSCILNYIDEDHRGGFSAAGPDKGVKCPTCDTVIHESQPKQHIASDSTMDEIVMKIVPGLRDRELQREEEFYKRKNLKWPKAEMIAAEKEAAAKKRKLEGGDGPSAKSSMTNGTSDISNGTDGKEDSGHSTVDELEEDPEEESGSHDNFHRGDVQIRFILEPAPEEKSLGPLPHKYVLCSEHTPVSAIKKVVCKQLSLTSPNQVDLLCDGAKLGRDHSMKFVFITKWRGRKDHLLIKYRSSAAYS